MARLKAVAGGLLTLVAILCAPVASADVQHRVKFGQGPLVVVWDEDGEKAAGASVSLNDRGVALPEPAGSAPIVTGMLLPIQPVSLTRDRSQRRVYIASNAPFRIRAVASGAGSGDVDISATRVFEGANAQVADGLGSGTERVVVRAGGTVDVVVSAERTARLRGAVDSQAIGYDLSWDAPDGVSVSFLVEAR